MRFFCIFYVPENMSKAIVMHIGILVTNTDRSAFAARHESDGEKFARLIAHARPDWTTTAFDCVAGEFPDAEPDAYVIGGSPASVHDDVPWIPQLLDLIRVTDRPILGACFGHQAVALALGGVVGRNPGSRFVLGCVDTMLDGTPLRIAAAHQEQVTTLPPGARVLGSGPDCPIAAFAIGARILTTQYHPEMTPDFIAALTDQLGGDDAARASLATPSDPAQHARWVCAFLDNAHHDRTAKRSIAVT
jgi:GMP synthase-like glutamine amidotransferase